MPEELKSELELLYGTVSWIDRTWIAVACECIMYVLMRMYRELRNESRFENSQNEAAVLELYIQSKWVDRYLCR